MSDKPGRQQLSGYLLRDYDDLIATLSASRESQGLSQEALAEGAGYASRSSISYVLSGTYEVPGRRLFDLAYALGYDLALVPRESGEAHA